jgi:sulfur-oxidizing protein SoxX
MMLLYKNESIKAPCQGQRLHLQYCRRERMQKTATGTRTFTLALTMAISMLTLLSAKTTMAADTAMVKKGMEIAFDRKKGNCLSCHHVEGGTMMGNIGPPLIAMKARFPDKAKLRAQIWDSTASNPNSLMPPFGKHRALTESEIDLIVEYVLTL